MAEGFARALGAGLVEARSAGLEPKGLNPYAVRATAEVHWLLPDPAAATGDDETVMGVFRAVRDQIERAVRGMLAELGARQAEEERVL